MSCIRKGIGSESKQSMLAASLLPGERKRVRERERDRQTDRQIDRWTGRQRNRERERNWTFRFTEKKVGFV